MLCWGVYVLGAWVDPVYFIIQITDKVADYSFGNWILGESGWSLSRCRYPFEWLGWKNRDSNPCQDWALGAGCANGPKWSCWGMDMGQKPVEEGQNWAQNGELLSVFPFRVRRTLLIPPRPCFLLQRLISIALSWYQILRNREENVCRMRTPLRSTSMTSVTFAKTPWCTTSFSLLRILKVTMRPNDFSSVCWSDRHSSHLFYMSTRMLRVMYESHGQSFSQRKQEIFTLFYYDDYYYFQKIYSVRIISKPAGNRWSFTKSHVPSVTFTLTFLERTYHHHHNIYIFLFLFLNPTKAIKFHDRFSLLHLCPTWQQRMIQ